jgi:hypothetical protein
MIKSFLQNTVLLPRKRPPQAADVAAFTGLYVQTFSGQADAQGARRSAGQTECQ